MITLESTISLGNGVQNQMAVGNNEVIMSVVFVPES